MPSVSGREEGEQLAPQKAFIKKTHQVMKPDMQCQKILFQINYFSYII
jgi:hypothetical protein